MTSEEKDLLLRDLCGRLPYEVILVAPNGKTTYQTDGNTGAELLVEEGFKPYLRPMSSMTNEEIETYRIIIKSLLENSITDNVATLYNFLNSKHLDYNALIPQGLAIEAPEGMYKKGE